jgi:ribonuclease T1
MARMGLRRTVAWPVPEMAARPIALSHCFDSIRRVAAAAALVALATFASGGFELAQARSTPSDYAAADIGTVAVAQLPPEAVNTLGLIAAGGPYPYEKDGVVFGNYERMLPSHRRGYYHEYTVPTPHARNRGAKRIVCGGPLRQTDNCYYSDDHYASFKRIVE